MPPDFEPAESTYDLGFLGAEHVDEILAVEPGNKREEVLEWFDEGKLCFGVRNGSRLIARMWCDLKALSFDEDYEAIEFSPSDPTGEFMNHLESKLKG